MRRPAGESPQTQGSHTQGPNTQAPHAQDPHTEDPQTKGPPIGVLALQGGFAAHSQVLGGLRIPVREVRVPGDLDGLSGLVLPGGESTTMMLGIAREGLADPLRAFAAAGKPILATCAGLIILDRDHLGVIDVRCERNAFGRQVRSFETDLDLAGFAEPVRAVFIRAPWIVDHGSGVDVLGAVDGHVVAVREQRILATAFHPELSGETQLHAWLLDEAGLRPRARS